ncbi:lytic murein transglycosylase B [Leeia oryzae]|uniref:lytic murein transglycosylase B n=1 Tax=Leeia oryzae TaxID=356662 RepID=UPI00037EC9C5|nr:lytic murein transglycosylase B [Leeia oryzae]
MKTRTISHKALTGLLLTLGLVSHHEAIASDLAARPEVTQFINDMVSKHQFDKSELFRIFDDVVEKPKIIEALDKPSTSRPWYLYHPNFINVTRISHGLAFMKQYAPELAAAEKQYGVPAEVIAAILGVETDYGRNAGSFRAIDALSTIAFDYPRRADYYKGELEAFLILARDEKLDPASFKSSYAGALGLPQFMPSSFHQYAVDATNDQHKDIWNTPADAIASVANYLHSFGWQKDQNAIVKATVTGETYPTLVADKFNLHYTIADMAKFGVTPAERVDAQEKAVLFPIETAPDKIEYLLGLNNFYVITRYNKSTLYALSVINLANTLKTGMASLQETAASS